MKIIYSPQFRRKYKKLPFGVKKEAEIKEKIFRKNPFDEKLNTHKLHGRLKDFWAFSINKNYRLIFEFGKKDAIYFHTIGDHRIYK